MLKHLLPSFIMLGTISSVVNAQTSNPPAPQPPPQIVVTPEKNLKLVFTSGNEAMVMMNQSDTRIIPVPFQMTENTCRTDIPAPDCRLLMRAETRHLALSWIKHPEKTGKTVQFKSNYVGGALIEDIEVNLPNDQDDHLLICNDFRWLHGDDNKTTYRNFSIPAWTAEVNSTNSETNANENLGLSGGIQLILESRFGQYYAIKTPPQINTVAGNRAFFSSGPITMILRNHNEPGFCQVQFVPQLGKAIEISGILFGQVLTRPMQPATLSEKEIEVYSRKLEFFKLKSGEYL